MTDLKQVFSYALHGFLLEQGARVWLGGGGQQCIEGWQGAVHAPVLFPGQLICPTGCDTRKQGEELHGLEQ